MALNGVDNNVVVANDSTIVQPQQAEQKDNTVVVFETKQDNTDMGITVESSDGTAEKKTVDKQNSKGRTKNDYQRPISQYEIKNYLRDPHHTDSNMYQKKMEEINKLSAKKDRTIADDIRLQNLKNEVKNIERRVRFILMENRQENPHIIEKNGAKKLLTVELLNVVDTKKVVKNNTSVNNNKENQEASTNSNEQSEITNHTDNTFGVRVTGMYSKNGTTAGMDATLGSDYIFNGSLEHIKKNSTFGINGSAKITSETDVDASAHAYYVYTKDKTEFSAKGNYSIYSGNIDNGEKVQRERFQEGNVSLSLDTPHFGAEAVANFSDTGNAYSVNVNGSYGREWKNGVSFDGVIDAGYTYQDELKFHTANFGLNTKVSYKADDIQGYVAVDARGSYARSNTYKQVEYTCSGSVDVGVLTHNFDLNTHFLYEGELNEYTVDNKLNKDYESALQYGVCLGYTFPKSGVGLNAGYSGTIELTGEHIENNLKSPKNKINVKIIAPFGQFIEKYLTSKAVKTAEKAEDLVL